MSSVISSIFGKPEPSGPSAEELAEQERLERIEKRKTDIEKDKGRARAKISSARAAGPQTLFTTTSERVLPTTLGGK